MSLWQGGSLRIRVMALLVAVVAITAVTIVLAQSFSVTIGDFVFFDANNNGVQDDDEDGIEGVEVNLYADVDGDGNAEPGGDDGSSIDTTETDDDGNYFFNVEESEFDSFFVEFELPSEDFAFSTQNVDDGDDNPDQRDSDVDEATGFTDVFTFDNGETDLTIDAGIRECTAATALDLVFVIDATGSMIDDIAAIESASATIADEVRSAVPDSQFAVVSYKDYPPDGTYPSQVDQDLTTSISDFVTAIENLDVSGGGDLPESVYAGLDAALDLDFRSDSARLIVLIGDAEAKDPEPVSGLTLSDITDEANAQNVSIYSVVAAGGTVSDFTPISSGTGGIVIAAVSAEAITDAILDALDFALCTVRPTDDDDDDGDGGGDDDDDDGDDDDDDGGDAPAPGRPAAPQPILCDDLGRDSGLAMTSSSGIANAVDPDSGEIGSVYCRIIAVDASFVTDPGEVGIQEVLDRNVVQAVDLFGLLDDGTPVIPYINPMQVCLRGSGTVFFLDANEAARTVVGLGSSVTAGYTCVNVFSAGTIVLTGSLIPPAPLPAATPVPGGETTTSGTTLENCQVTTVNAPLNLRAEPNMDSEVLAQLAFNLQLRATDREPGWFQVVYQDMQGWVSDTYLVQQGDCGG